MTTAEGADGKGEPLGVFDGSAAEAVPILLPGTQAPIVTRTVYVPCSAEINAKPARVLPQDSVQ